MRRFITMGFAIVSVAIAGPAAGVTISDPAGDFLSSFSGTPAGDLDVTRFSANYDNGLSTFKLDWTLAGNVDPTVAGLYAVGVNTGAGAVAPFADVGAPNVIFDQVIAIQKNGSGFVTGPAGGLLAADAVKIAGNMISVSVPLSLLPSTGFKALNYRFNLWPRTGLGGNDLISDFAPDNATIKASAVPEPGNWTLMLGGFAAIGMIMRRSRKQARPVLLN